MNERTPSYRKKISLQEIGVAEKQQVYYSTPWTGVPYFSRILPLSSESSVAKYKRRCMSSIVNSRGTSPLVRAASNPCTRFPALPLRREGKRCEPADDKASRILRKYIAENSPRKSVYFGFGKYLSRGSSTYVFGTIV